MGAEDSEGCGTGTGCGGGCDDVGGGGGGTVVDGDGTAAAAGCNSDCGLINSNWRSGTKICNGGGLSRGGKSNWGRARIVLTNTIKNSSSYKNKILMKFIFFKRKTGFELTSFMVNKYISHKQDDYEEKKQCCCFIYALYYPHARMNFY